MLPPYRTKRTVELLWHGIWAYVLAHGVDVMIGCASLEGTDPDRLALPLSFLHHYARAPEDWRVSALPERAVAMNRLAKEAVDPRAALHALPPLIKGYLRLGAYIGEHAVVDHQFGTTDVLIVMPVSALNPRYVSYYGADASRQQDLGVFRTRMRHREVPKQPRGRLPPPHGPHAGQRASRNTR